MLQFEPFSLAALQRLLPYIRGRSCSCSDLSAGSLFMWEAGTDLQFCEWNSTLVIRQTVGAQPAFCWPIGAHPDEMLDLLLQDVQSRQLPLRFFAVDEPTLARIRSDSRLKSPMWAYDVRWSDYLYSFEEAKHFPGRKFSGQRNHINKFKKLYGEPQLRFLSRDDLPAVQRMLAEYEAEHGDGNRLERLELAQTRRLLSVYEALGLHAAGLFVDGQIAAFSIGEIIGDMLLIHIEKALKRFEGAYPVMYSGFVRLMDSLPGHELQLVNREDDSGDPGIRISKQQYHPLGQIHKYLVHVDSPAARMGNASELRSGPVVLTSFQERDRKAYYDLNTDVENNRYWGYDYREDASITGPIDEDTFFDSALFDMQLGDSINFAVRLESGGEMIGEAILWNFSSDGRAELGCRILPQYQGRGYGKAAFRAAAAFAEQHLHLSLYARCDRENAASRRMILAAGFRPWYEAEPYQYFTREPVNR